MFIIGPLSFLMNPSHIMRKGIYSAIKRFAPEITGRVLDFGCGSKPYEELFDPLSYTGVDIEISGHDHATSKVDRFYDGHTIPFEDGAFDSVIAFEVFEHIFNVEEILGEVRRVLRPHGKLLLSIPFAWPEHEVPYDRARYTSFGIEKLLTDAGFDVVHTVKTTTSVRAIAQLAIVYVSDHCLPQHGLISKLLRLMIIFPMNVTAMIADFVLPNRYDFYSGLVVLATSAAPDVS
jgi:SAM-dependent methyltransferase